MVGDRISMIVKAYDAVGDDDDDGFARYSGDDEDAGYGVEDDVWDDDACNDDVGGGQRGDASDGEQYDAWGDRHDGGVGDRRNDDTDGKRGEAVYNEHVRDVDALDNALPVLLKAVDR